VNRRIEGRVRVTLVSFDFGEYSIRLASALSGLATVLLLLPRPVAAPYLSELDPKVDLQLFDKPRLRHPRRQLLLGRELIRQIKSFGPDVVHLQHGHLWFNAILPLLRRYPLVVTAHDARHHVGDRSSRKTPQAIVNFGFRRASRLIVHARQVKEVIVRECGLSPDIVDVVPHISLGSSQDATPSREPQPTVLFFGRIWDYKGLEYLIRAEPFITAEVPGAKIVIAGEGDDFEQYRRLMVHPERFVVYNEYVSDDLRAMLFQQASVVALPYIEASQSGVLPLAYMHMKPVVATTVGGLPEMIEEGRTGYLVPPRDEWALATAVVRLLRDADLRRRFGLNGKRKLDEECAPADIARQTLEVYHSALDPAHASAPVGAIHEERA
jgi:glycosyltransferase involved in cell wall biosynthesis